MQIHTTRNLLLSLTLAAAPLLGACADAPEGTQEESPELAGIVMENDALSGQVTTASGIALKEGEIHQEQAKFIELNNQFMERTGRKLSGVRLTERQAAILKTMLDKEALEVALRKKY